MSNLGRLNNLVSEDSVQYSFMIDPSQDSNPAIENNEGDSYPNRFTALFKILLSSTTYSILLGLNPPTQWENKRCLERSVLYLRPLSHTPIKLNTVTSPQPEETVGYELPLCGLCRVNNTCERKAKIITVDKVLANASTFMTKGSYPIPA